jgi:hypothetical protein
MSCQALDTRAAFALHVLKTTLLYTLPQGRSMICLALRGSMKQGADLLLRFGLVSETNFRGESSGSYYC